MLVYLRDGSAQTNLRTATLRQKLQIKLSTSPTHSILTPGRPVPGSSALEADALPLGQRGGRLAAVSVAIRRYQCWSSWTRGRGSFLSSEDRTLAASLLHVSFLLAISGVIMLWVQRPRGPGQSVKILYIENRG